ncbi:MAG TPA: 2-C-methyl-D-erythritol 2,4-cyclodiphosphate synthase [Acidobacteriota bacterium]|nr:2-C-methyl-D-erythritol 2,4-cyclodiphosphate synthase [Acidobacteriota bacterium]
MTPRIRIGIGFDAHRFADNRKLMLGGVEISHARGLRGHSDADVLLHALCDALLGAAGLDDLGSHFPDTENRWKDAPSSLFVNRILGMIHKRGWIVANADLTLIAQAPRLGRHRITIRRAVAKLLKVDEQNVNIKATTTDHLGFTGREEGIAAQAVVLLAAGKPSRVKKARTKAEADPFS